MAKLLFFDESHRYELDGEVLPSVSELCRFLSREVYDSVSQYKLDKAAYRGTTVHKVCEALDLYGKAEISDEYAPYIENYIKFRKEHSVKWEFVEKSFYHVEKRYAGTIDRYGDMDGRKVLIDLKTSSVVQKKIAVAQMNLYRWMLEEQGNEVEAMYILHLTSDGYKLVPIDFNDEVPEALITLHRHMEKKRRKKREQAKI